MLLSPNLVTSDNKSIVLPILHIIKTALYLSMNILFNELESKLMFSFNLFVLKIYPMPSLICTTYYFFD